MKVSVQSIHFDADVKLLEFIQKKCDKLDVFFDRIVDANVYLKLEKHEPKQNKLVEIKVHVPGETLIATEYGTSFEEATDFCTEKLKAQLKRFKEKHNAHHASKISVPIISEIEND